MKKSIILLILCFLQGVVFSETITLARNERLIEQLVAEHVLVEIYKKAGVTLLVAPLPPARATLEVTKKKYHGEVARIYTYKEKVPELIRVEPSYYFLTTVVFYRKDSAVVIADASDLKKYRVGIINGVRHSLDATVGVPNVTVAGSAESLFRMLKAGNIDVVVDTGINGRYLSRVLKMEDMLHTVVLTKLELFNYLQPEMRVLASNISDVIQKMTTSGELRRMIEKTESQVLEQAMSVKGSK